MRRFPELDQVQMQRAVCAYVAAGRHLPAMVVCAKPHTCMVWPVRHEQTGGQKNSTVWKAAIIQQAMLDVTLRGNSLGTAHGEALPCVAVGDDRNLGHSDGAQKNGRASPQGSAALGAANGQADVPHVGAQAQAQAERDPGQATAALVHDLAERADCSSRSASSSASGSALLHSGASIKDEELDEWILENLNHPKMRSKRVDVLTAAAKPIQYSHAEVLMTIGNIYDRNVD